MKAVILMSQEQIAIKLTIVEKGVDKSCKWTLNEKFLL